RAPLLWVLPASFVRGDRVRSRWRRPRGVLVVEEVMVLHDNVDVAVETNIRLVRVGTLGVHVDDVEEVRKGGVVVDCRPHHADGTVHTDLFGVTVSRHPLVENP